MVGFNFEERTAILCEVTTHIRGLLYGPNAKTTVQKIRDKHTKQRRFAAEWLESFDHHRFMFWSPVVPGATAVELAKIGSLELVINGDYLQNVELLRRKAKEWSHDIGNPAFRLLQIIEHTRR